jgi:hypothetical protein
VGKTSLAAQPENTVFSLASSETGLLTLIDAGQLPQIDHFEPAADWETLKDQVRALIENETSYRVYAVDTLNLVERLCHEYVCHKYCDDDWGKKGFLSYNAGYELSLTPIREYLNLLDELRERRKMSILLLAHSKIKPFRNPEGADFDRFTVDIHEKTWSLVDRWADMVLFLNYETHVTQVQESKTQKKGKGMGADHRIMYTRRTAAFDAKNRLGLPAEIDMGNSAQEGWAAFIEAAKQAKEAGIQEGV